MATLSPQRAPALICPAPSATARSAAKGSQVSPERSPTMHLYPASRAMAAVSHTSDNVPIWLGFSRIALALFRSMP